MVRTSGIREKLRSRVLDELAKERASSSKPASKRAKIEANEDQQDNESDEEQLRPAPQTTGSNSLLSILPPPRGSFGPTIRIDKLLKMPERVERPEPVAEAEEQKLAKFRGSSILDTQTNVIVPKGKEKQKNQISYLAQLSKSKELEHKELAAQGRLNKAATRNKYGW